MVLIGPEVAAPFRRLGAVDEPGDGLIGIDAMSGDVLPFPEGSHVGGLAAASLPRGLQSVLVSGVDWDWEASPIPIHRLNTANHQVTVKI